MYIIEKLKLNKFKDVKIPTKREYFMRVGQVNMSVNSYTGDEQPKDLNKTEMFEEMTRLAEQAKEVNGKAGEYVKDKEE